MVFYVIQFGMGYQRVSHGRRSVVCYSPWGRKESDTTERLHFSALITRFPWWLSGKDSACHMGDPGSIPGLGRSAGEGNGRLLIPVFLPGESHGQRSLAGYSPWGRKESDTTEQLHFFPSGNFHKPLILLPSQGRQTENHNHRKLTSLITWTTALSNSVKL